MTRNDVVQLLLNFLLNLCSKQNLDILQFSSLFFYTVYVFVIAIRVMLTNLH